MDIAISGFSSIPGVTEEIAQGLVEQGYLSYDDLSVIEPEVLMEMSGLAAEQVEEIVEQAEMRAQDAEEAAAEERRIRRERDRQPQGSAVDEVVEAQGDEPGSADGVAGELSGDGDLLAEADEVLAEADDVAASEIEADEVAAGEMVGSADGDAESAMVDDGAEATGSSPKSP
jgi:N utilization substance protein A